MIPWFWSLPSSLVDCEMKFFPYDLWALNEGAQLLILTLGRMCCVLWPTQGQYWHNTSAGSTPGNNLLCCRYYRLPLPMEGAPLEEDFDAFVNILRVRSRKNVNHDTPIKTSFFGPAPLEKFLFWCAIKVIYDWNIGEHLEFLTEVRRRSQFLFLIHINPFESGLSVSLFTNSCDR